MLHNLEDSTFGGGEVLVATYFYDAYKALRDDFVSNLAKFRDLYPTYTVFFTGHSLGGALATHAALDSALLGLVYPEETIIYTQGSPRVGFEKFADYFDKMFKETYRVVYWKDAIARVPDGL